jgi:diacylglycerol kinase
MSDDPIAVERSWAHRFRDAFRGIKAGVRGQSSFFVHFFVATTVIATATVLRMDTYEWCLLLLCIAGVTTAEMFNSAIESMAKAITGESDPHVGDSLDIASGAVLVASIGAAIIGTIVFVHHLGISLEWW